MKIPNDNLIIIAMLMLVFLLGLYSGSILQQQFFIKAAVKIAEGLEGTTFNIEVDINETLFVDRLFDYINESELKENNK